MQPTKVPAGLQLPARDRKPRRKGLTSIIDYGPDCLGWGGENGIGDLLACASQYIDFAKIYALNSLLIPAEVVTRIVKQYQDADITCYAGGILFEHAYMRGELPALLAYLRVLGFGALEVSENYLVLNDEQRCRCFDQCTAAGLSVVYEFGRKNPETPLQLETLESIVKDAKNAGVEHIIIEQSEITLTARDDPAILHALQTQSWFDQILIEADPFRFPEQHVGLIRDFGADVSLANVAPGQALRLEGLRQGIGRAVDYELFKTPAPPPR